MSLRAFRNGAIAAVVLLVGYLLWGENVSLLATEFTGRLASKPTTPQAVGGVQILNYVDYLNPDVVARFEETDGVKTAVTTYDTEEGALNKLRSGAFTPDLIIGMTDSVLSRLVAAELLQPLNHSYLSNFGNVIEGLRDPYYDVGAQYTTPYIIYSTGIGYRTDMDVDTSYFESGNG